MNMQMGDIIDWLRGPENSQVAVVVQTEDQEPRALEMIRKVIRVKTVHLAAQEPVGTATVNVLALNASTVSDLQELLETLPDSIKTLQLNLPYSDDLHLNVLLFDALAVRPRWPNEYRETQ